MTTVEILETINELIKHNLSFDDDYCIPHIEILQRLFFRVYESGAGMPVKLLADQYKTLFTGLPTEEGNKFAGNVISFMEQIFEDPEKIVLTNF